MKVDCDWNGKLNFVANINGFKVHMDAAKPFGEDKAPQPKQLLLASVCGCTGMDVVSLLKKYKQPPEKFKIKASSEVAKDHPHELKEINLKYLIDGKCDSEKVLEAIKLSQTKYCAVSSIVSRGTNISYSVQLNGKKIGDGKADFKSLTHEAEPQRLQA